MLLPALFAASLTLAPSVQARSAAGDAAPPNVLVVVLDDVSAYELPCYGLPGAEAQTPRLDQLAQQGVLFERAWSYPICSPTRAALLTGRYGFRTGIGANINKNATVGLGREEVFLPELLRNHAPHPYSDIALGKWHIGTANTGGVLAPNVAGFGSYSGVLHNLVGEENYYTYELTEDGEQSLIEEPYLTTQQVDSALSFIRETPEPWYCHLALTAPHEPWHAPPSDLHHTPIFPTFDVKRSMFIAMLEAADTELGRLWDSLDPEVRSRTTFIVLGDNGTHGPAVGDGIDPTHAKGSLYEGGVHVPLLVTGRGVADPGRREPALVHVVDVYATVAELAGIPKLAPPGATGVDSVSMVPYLRAGGAPSQRQFLFTERFGPNGQPFNNERRAMRDERYKLIRFGSHSEHLYDLELDPNELDNLMLAPLAPEAEAAYQRLSQALDGLLHS